MMIQPKYWISFVILFSILGALLFCSWIYFQIKTPFKNYSDGKFIIIERGESSNLIAERLAGGGIISNKFTFLIYLLIKKREGGRIKAGEYYFDAPANQIAVLDKLIKGRVFQHAVTIPEGSTIFEVANLLAETGLFKKENVLDEMSNTKLVKDIDEMAESLEGYLFPDTYLFTRDAGISELIKMMVKRFRNVYDEKYKKRASGRGLSTKDVITLASLIEKETGKPEERPLIAAVFMNRLKRDMPLQCDPTAAYAKLREGKPVKVINRETLSINSPYNTYKHIGLPPGPIANPGRKAIEAALYPAKVDYLYFVSKNDGTHYFSRSFAQHNEAIDKYLRSNNN